jgi:hypothetical protein
LVLVAVFDGVSVGGKDGVLVGHTQSPLFKPAPFVAPELLVAQFC